jgi:hypothetical protein
MSEIKLHDPVAVKAAMIASLDHEGTLYPATVVEVAKSPNHPLHRYFEWDNEKAAQAYRISQACEVIESLTETIPRREAGQVTANDTRLRVH